MPKRILTLWDNEQLNEADARTLRARCAEAPYPFDKATKEAIRELAETFFAREDAVGLAAPQIGIGRRIIAFRCRGFDDKDPGRKKEDCEILINPRITQKRGELVVGEEGCLSCPELHVEIERYPEIKVRAYDLEGRKVSKRYLDFAARVVQHEMDHLEGKLIVDHEGAVTVPKKRQEFFEKLFRGKEET
ncbi:MAG: peptide deformylase [Syntrophales bacterium]